MIIELTQGYQAVIDDSDWDLVRGYRWYALKTGRKNVYTRVYALTAISGKTMLMHRLLMKASKGDLIDHIDGDPLNNRRANLRLASYSENNMNRRRVVSRTGFKGVVFDPRYGGVWRAKINFGGKRISLGSFSSAEEAARAYDAASRAHHGRFGVTNSEMVTL